MNEAERYCNENNKVFEKISIVCLIGLTLLMWLYIINSTCNAYVQNDYIGKVSALMNPDYIKESLMTKKVLYGSLFCVFSNWLSLAVFQLNYYFEEVLTVIAIFMMGLVFRGRIIWSENIKKIGNKTGTIILYLIILLILFSLSKWEMILNSTGYPHFCAYASFFFYYLLLDQWYRYKQSKLYCLVLFYPILTYLLWAAFYISVLSMTTSLVICIRMYLDKASRCKQSILVVISSLAPSIIYVVAEYLSHATRIMVGESRSQAMDVIPVILSAPHNSCKFLVMSFASELLGVEAISRYGITEGMVMFLGVIDILFYLIVITVFFRNKMYENGLFPIFLIITSLVGHLIIFYSRIGMGVTYGMSSRYSLTYFSGQIGMIYIVYDYLQHSSKKIRSVVKRGDKVFVVLLAIAAVIIVVCNGITSFDEIRMMPFREAYYEGFRKTIYYFENYSKKELSTAYGNTDQEETLRVLKFLKKKHLNAWTDIGSHYREIYKSEGFYDDGWISDNVNCIVKTREKGIVTIHCYYPDKPKKGGTISVRSNNGSDVKKNLRQGKFDLQIKEKKDDYIMLEITTNWTDNSNEDIRGRSFVVEGIEGT